MAIAQNLTDILAARYGRDVRQAIHDGISECYDDVTSGQTLAGAAAANADAKAALAVTATTNANAATAAANTATSDANTATSAANTATTNADNATTAANNAATLANTKAGLADTAADNADAKAALAVTATTNANTATSAANTEATNAGAKAALAVTATTNANAATTAANNAATLANTKAGLADTAAANADAKALLANTAATTANTATGLANSATAAANTATEDANTAAALANTKAGLADTATTNANTKAALANAAALNADAKAALAVSATSNADLATTAANNAATLANTKAGLADTAAANADAKAALAVTATTNAVTATTNANNAADYANAVTQPYIHIKYSAINPVIDNDMKDTVDEWIGVYHGMSATAPTAYTSYTWYQFKGEQGDVSNHDHGNILNAGTIGAVAGKYLVTGTGGVIETKEVILGGANLIPNTNYAQGLDGWQITSGDDLSIIALDEATLTPWNGPSIAITGTVLPCNLIVATAPIAFNQDDTLMLSFWLDGVASGVSASLSDGVNTPVAESALNQTYKKRISTYYYYEFPMVASSGLSGLGFLSINIPSVTKVCRVKMELGTEASDWSLSPFEVKPTYTPEEVGALAAGATAADSDMLDGQHASAFAAASHAHGNLTTDGKIGTVADKTLMTTTDGLVVAKTMEEAIAIWKFTNPNLLHNWDFRNPVNQRGVSGNVTTNVPFYDRWFMATYTTMLITINSNYLTLAGGCELAQFIEGLKLKGKTVTASVKLYGSETVLFGTATFPATDTGSATMTIAGFGTIVIHNLTDRHAISIRPTSTLNVECVKLELGTVSTLAYDPPMDHAVELAKCQRYFVRLKPSSAYGLYAVGVAVNASQVFYPISLPCPMRSFPSMTISGTLNQSNLLVTSMSGSTLHVTQSGSFTEGVARVLLNAGDSNAYIDLSSDL